MVPKTLKQPSEITAAVFFTGQILFLRPLVKVLKATVHVTD